MKGIIKSKSEINYSYATIKITQSRIDKGLIAIPTSLEKWFPDHIDTIVIKMAKQRITQHKRFVPDSTHLKFLLRKNFFYAEIIK